MGESEEISCHFCSMFFDLLFLFAWFIVFAVRSVLSDLIYKIVCHVIVVNSTCLT